MREHMEKHIRTAYGLLMEMEVSHANVRRLALAEQELERALEISAKMAQAEQIKTAKTAAEEATHE